MTGVNRLWERKALAAGILVLSLVVLGAGYRVLRNGAGRFFDDFFYPYLHLSKLGSSALADMSLLAYSRRELAAKLEDLQRRNRTLALQAAAAGELLQENEELRKLIEFSAPRRRSYLAAEIILRDPLRWRERFTVDRGEADGVRRGAAVIDVSGDGRMALVGVIERTGRHTSTVLTLRNGALRLSARIGASGTVGFVNVGSGRNSDAESPTRRSGKAFSAAVFIIRIRPPFSASIGSRLNSSRFCRALSMLASGQRLRKTAYSIFRSA